MYKKSKLKATERGEKVTKKQTESNIDIRESPPSRLA
jgi:hypothetical protein